MSKATTENDRSISTKIVAATFQNGIGPEEVSGEKIYRNYRDVDARKLNYLMEKVIFQVILFPNVLSTLLLTIFTF